MANKLLTYLQGISGNTAELKLFHDDPSKAGAKAGLSNPEIAALVSRNPGVISKAIKVGGGAANANDDINVTIVVVVA